MHPDLITRYADERLPRYTSYPAAPHFSASVRPETYAGWLADIQPERVGSLYVHIPYCRRMWRAGDRIVREADARNVVRAVAAAFDAYRARSARTHSPAL